MLPPSKSPKLAKGANMNVCAQPNQELIMIPSQMSIWASLAFIMDLIEFNNPPAFSIFMLTPLDTSLTLSMSSLLAKDSSAIILTFFNFASSKTDFHSFYGFKS